MKMTSSLRILSSSGTGPVLIPIGLRARKLGEKSYNRSSRKKKRRQSTLDYPSSLSESLVDTQSDLAMF